MRLWLSSARIRRISVGGVEISTATTSVRGTITSRQRLSESSNTLRISSGALASTPLFAACAASIRSSSSSGGGGGSNRARILKGRRTRLTPASSTRANGPSTAESRPASQDSRSAAISGSVLAMARAVTSASAASIPTKRTPASGAASAPQNPPRRETSNCTIAGGASAPTPAARKPLSTMPMRREAAVVSRWVRSRSTRRPDRPWSVASSLAFSSETPESADSAAAMRARTSRSATQPGHSAQDCMRRSVSTAGSTVLADALNPR